MEVKRGDIAVVVLAGDLGKPRPGVIVQANELGEATTTVLICPISSDVMESLSLRPILEPSPETGLRIRSQIMADKLVALHRDRIKRTIGMLDSGTQEELDRALLVILGLAR